MESGISNNDEICHGMHASHLTSTYTAISVMHQKFQEWNWILQKKNEEWIVTRENVRPFNNNMEIYVTPGEATNLIQMELQLASWVKLLQKLYDGSDLLFACHLIKKVNNHGYLTKYLMLKDKTDREKTAAFTISFRLSLIFVERLYCNYRFSQLYPTLYINKNGVLFTYKDVIFITVTARVMTLWHV